MNQPLFDLNLLRVTREHYITGKAAINFPYPETTTGGWHYLSYWDRDAGACKVSLAGIHFPDTTAFFGVDGVLNVTELMADRGWPSAREVWMADHYRAAADMVVRWALSDSLLCSVGIDDWFPSDTDRQKFLCLIESAKAQLGGVGKLVKVEQWLLTQI